MKRSRYFTGPLALFDYFLGILAIGFPGYYTMVMHSAQPTGIYLLQRTGAIWLFFALCETIAFLKPTRYPSMVLVVAALRLMDTPADVVYYITSSDLTFFGRFILLFGPVFNAIAATSLWRLWRQHERERVATTATATASATV